MFLASSSLLSLALAFSVTAEPPKKVLLIAQGPDGHPLGTHEYVAGLDVLAMRLKNVPGLEIQRAFADGAWKEGPELLAHADGVVLFVSEGARWIDADPQRREAFRKFAAKGGGVVALHWAIGTRDAKHIGNFLDLAGGCHGGPDRKFKVIETEASIGDTSHPIAAGLGDFRVHDEFYYGLKFMKPEGSTRPLLRVTIDGQPETVAWTWERPDRGRSFGFSGLHFHDNWRLPEYRRLIAQAVLWTIKLPIPRNGLTVAVNEQELNLPLIARYLRPAKNGFEKECEFLVQRDSRGWAIRSVTERGKATLAMQSRYDEKENLLAAEVSFVAGESKKTATVQISNARARVNREQQATQEFDVRPGTIVTSAPDWTDVFLMCERYDRKRKGLQKFPGLWIHPTQPAQQLTFSMERLGGDTIQHRGRKVELDRYQIRLRGNSVYLAWADAKGTLIKLMPLPSREGIVGGLMLKDYEKSAAVLRARKQ